MDTTPRETGRTGQVEVSELDRIGGRFEQTKQRLFDAPLGAGGILRGLQTLSDALLRDPILHAHEEDRMLDAQRQRIQAEGRNPFTDPEFARLNLDIMASRVVMGMTGDLGAAGRALGPQTVQEVQRLSSIAQRLRALGLENDARAAESEMRLASAAQPEGIATRQHVEHLEDIVNTKQTGEHYTGKPVEQAADLARLEKMRRGVESREAAAAKGETMDQSFERMVGPKERSRPKEAPTDEAGLADFYSDRSMYHGSGAANISREHLDAYASDPQSLFGLGLYMTDDASVAASYASRRGGKTGTPTTYSGRVNVERPLNIERPLPGEVTKALNDALADDYYMKDSIDQLKKLGDSPTGSDWFKALRRELSDISQGESIPVYEFSETMGVVSETLQRLGYDAIHYKGGARTGSKPHNALVVLNPRKSLREFAPYKDSAGAGKPPTPPAEPPAPRTAEPPARPEGEGNLGINLDKVDAPQHVKDLIESEARAHIGDITEQRRGVQPLETIFAKARNLGIDTPQLAQVPKGTAFNAEGAVAIFNAIVKTADKRLAIEEEIRKAGALATPEMEARWLAAVYDQNTLQRVFAGGRAEAGRSLRALRELSSGAQSGQIKDTFGRALEAIGGRQNFDKLLSRLRAIQTHPTMSPFEREVAAFKFVGRLHRPGFWQKINEAFINSILSNPLTHEANVLGQTALYEADVLSQLPAALFDTVVSGGGRFRPRTRTIQGAIVQAVAGHMALRRGLQEGLLYMRHGVAAEAIEKFRETGIIQGQALEGSAGAILNLPTRALGAEDVFFNRIGYQRQLYQDAANYVARDGRDSMFGRSFWRRVADIVDHPEDFLMDGKSMQSRAEEAGRRAGLRQDAGDFQKSLQHVLHWEVGDTGFRPGVFIAPFVRIGFNLARVGTEYSPLGFIRSAKTTGGERADAFGRATLGTSLWAFFWSKADSGELTGAAPTDSREAAQFYDEGKRPYAIRVGNQWIEYSRYEPIATTLKWVHGFHEAAQDVAQSGSDPSLLGSGMLKAGGTLARSLTDSSYLSGLNDFFQIINSSDTQLGQKAERFGAGLANSILPYSGLRRFITQREDPMLRHASNAVEQIEAANPLISHLVRPYLTHWGEPVERPSLAGGISYGTETTDRVDVTLQEFLKDGKLDVDGQSLDAKQLSVGLVQADIDGLKLSPDEGFMLQQTAGRATHTALAELFSDNRQVKGEDGTTRRWSQMSERDKKQAVSAVISEARRTARAATADAILLRSTSDEAIRRAAKMRLSTISRVSDKADFLRGLQRQGKLTAGVRDYLNRSRGRGERSVEEYLRTGG